MKRLCGIIGYFGNRKAMPVILQGLEKLEYRGYDSVGTAALTQKGIVVKKDIGKVNEVNRKLNLSLPNANVAIGHTRWATHGNVTAENAHPHVDCNSEIAVVHNGIIDNYDELREMLTGNGHKFRSNTDTEVIPHLIEEELHETKSLEEACMRAVGKLDGTFALLIIRDNENKVIAVKKGSPLVIGIGNEETFAASDIPAFMKYTKKVAYLYDYDFVVLGNAPVFYNVKNGTLDKVERKTSEVDWKYVNSEKNGFEHYMLKEILEQINTIQRAIQQDSSLLDKATASMAHSKNIILTGCGTSYYACLAAKDALAKIADLNIHAVLASEFKDQVKFVDEKSVVVALSQSGETYDVLETIRLAKNAHAKVISVTNVRGSSLARESDLVIPMNAGPEISVLSTKTYTAQVALLSLLAYNLADRQNDGKTNMNYLWNVIYYLTAEGQRDLMKNLAEKLKNSTDIVCIGRGQQYPTALETALKIKEVSYIHAEAFAGGEMKHGPIALIEEGTPCITFVSESTEKDIISNAIEAKARGAYIVGVSPKKNAVFDFWIKVPECGNENPIVQIIPMQILAYQLAVLRGFDPDHPRSLAKSVTVK